MPVPTPPPAPTPGTVPGVLPTADPIHVVVVLPDHRPADPTNISSAIAPHVRSCYEPFPLYPLRGTRSWRPRRQQFPDVWHVLRRPDGVPVAAGGRRAHLDLQALTATATWQARQRWHAWNTHVAAGTPRARDWESFQTPRPERSRTSQPMSPDEARQRFETQPRVLTMLAVNAQHLLPFPLDPYELAAFQAGEHVYCTLAAHQAVVGQMLVPPHGPVHRPVTPALADRLRYLQAALDVVHRLHPDVHLVALLRTPT